MSRKHVSKCRTVSGGWRASATVGADILPGESVAALHLDHLRKRLTRECTGLARNTMLYVCKQTDCEQYRKICCLMSCCGILHTTPKNSHRFARSPGRSAVASSIEQKNHCFAISQSSTAAGRPVQLRAKARAARASRQVNALGCGSALRVQASVSHPDTSKLAESEGWYTRCVQRPDGFPVACANTLRPPAGSRGQLPDIGERLAMPKSRCLSSRRHFEVVRCAHPEGQYPSVDPRPCRILGTKSALSEFHRSKKTISLCSCPAHGEIAQSHQGQPCFTALNTACCWSRSVLACAAS